MCRVKPQGSGLYWNKGPSKAKLTTGPNLVKLVARWVCQAPKDFLQNNTNNNIFEHDTQLNDLWSINPKRTFWGIIFKCYSPILIVKFKSFRISWNISFFFNLGLKFELAIRGILYHWPWTTCYKNKWVEAKKANNFEANE